MNEEEKEELNANLLNADTIDAIIIIGTNGKEYRIEKKLPVKAGNIFNTLMMLYGISDMPEDADEIIKRNEKMMEMTIATIIAGNQKKYPELNKEAIIGTEEKEGIFTEFEIGEIYNLYLSRWLEISNRKMRSKTKDKKKEAERKTEGV